jgi:hypothetical protein
VIEFRQMAKGQEGADEMTNYLVFGPKIVDFFGNKRNFREIGG